MKKILAKPFFYICIKIGYRKAEKCLQFLHFYFEIEGIYLNYNEFFCSQFLPTQDKERRGRNFIEYSVICYPILIYN